MLIVHTPTYIRRCNQARHINLMSDELAEGLGLAGKPDELTLSFRTLSQAVLLMSNIGLSYSPRKQEEEGKFALSCLWEKFFPRLGAYKD